VLGHSFATWCLVSARVLARMLRRIFGRGLVFVEYLSYSSFTTSSYGGETYGGDRECDDGGCNEAEKRLRAFLAIAALA
jgi:hypothetical protein